MKALVRPIHALRTSRTACPGPRRCLLSAIPSMSLQQSKPDDRVSRSYATCPTRPYSTSTSTPPAAGTPPADPCTPSKPKRPSPYRLLGPTTFLGAFAPLHVNGWRLVPLPSASPLDGSELSQPQSQSQSQSQSPAHGKSTPDISRHTGDLQDRGLVKVYEFARGKEGWRALMAFSTRLMEQVEKQDHHPVLTISPASDYSPPLGLAEGLDPETGHVLVIATHTHTPLPPLGQPKEPKDGVKMRPGVTGKDINLATALDEVFGSGSSTC